MFHPHPVIFFRIQEEREERHKYKGVIKQIDDPESKNLTLFLVNVCLI